MRTRRAPAAPQNAHPQTQCRIFSLPAEVRHEIYALVLTIPPKGGHTIAFGYRRRKESNPSVLSLLATCCLIQREAQGLFYHLQMLHLNFRAGICNRYVPTDFATVLCPERLAVVHTMTFTVLTAVLKTLQCLPGLTLLALWKSRWCSADEDKEVAKLQKEDYFIKRACAKFPASLRHLLFHGVGR